MKRTSLMIVVIGLFFFAASALADWAPAKRITWTSGDSESPSIAVDSHGHLHVVWGNELPSYNKEIFYKKSTDGGATWTAAKNISGDSYLSASPVIAVDSSDFLHVVWGEDYYFMPYVFYARSTDAGVTWTNRRVICAGPGNSWNINIAIDSLDNLHLVWRLNATDNYEIYYRKSTDAGVTWSAIKQITWTSGSSESPVIAVDSFDKLHLVWADHTPGNFEIYYKSSTNAGVTWSSSKRLTWSSGNSFSPAVAVDSSDTLHLAWFGDSPGNYEVYYKKSTNGGVAWSTNKRLTWNTGNSIAAFLAVDLSDDLHVFWQDATPGNTEIFYKKSTNGGSVWSTIKRLSWTSTDSRYPAVAADSTGNLHLVWEDLKPGNLEIYYRKFVK